MSVVSADASSPQHSVVCFQCSSLTPDGPITSFGTPDGHYSRVCWLPVLGPTAWVLWATVARDLAVSHVLVRDVDELTHALGLGRPQRLLKALKRLDRFGIGIGTGSDSRPGESSWRLHAMCPPLRREHLRVLSETARRFHHDWIENLDDRERHDLYHVLTSAYVDHFGGHRTEGNHP